MPSAVINHPSSYKDPSGFIFEKNGTLYRQVNNSFKEHFSHFIESGFYDHLVSKNLLIPHEQFPENLSGEQNCYLTLKPSRLSFISYPYEWCFNMFKDAALLTLRLAREALDYDMVLKDATPYNIQWHQGRLIFIDTLSFEKYTASPWVAYRQFCEAFLGPLLLMHSSKQPLHRLQIAWPEGIPLNIIKSLLPSKSRFSLHTYLHIYLHAKIAARESNAVNKVHHFPKQKFLNLISSLEILVNKLKLPEQQSIWSGYYNEASQRDSYLDEKKVIIKEWLYTLKDSIKSGADIGANEGEFSKLLAENNIPTVAADFDAFCITRLYAAIKNSNEKYIHPVIQDISDPSPAIGANNNERTSFISRLNVDITLALALIHHLVIGKNIRFPLVADFFSKITEYLVIEFVPLTDEKARLLMEQKNYYLPGYDQENFESSFKAYFTVEKQIGIPGSQRILYLLKKK